MAYAIINRAIVDVNRMKTALITGASSGIGYELAKRFAADGYRLLLIARDEAKLDAAAKELRAAHQANIRTAAVDLAAPSAAAELARVLEKEPIHILVNNAGVGMYGAFAESDISKTVGMLELNVLSLTMLTRLVLPRMLEAGSGRILNVASVAGFLPGPFMAGYFASKAYVVSFSAALREELRDTGLSVTCLCPGATPSGFQSTAGYETPALKSGNVLSAEAVAQAGYAGLKSGRAFVVPGWQNKLFVFASRFVSPTFAARVVRRWNS